jgi:hypothetical protein
LATRRCQAVLVVTLALAFTASAGRGGQLAGFFLDRQAHRQHLRRQRRGVRLAVPFRDNSGRWWAC